MNHPLTTLRSWLGVSPATPSADGAAREGLARDNRGVIMIAGIFFTFVWIGLVWFILGVATAINYHENLQNAADAGAFAGAVYDARGMNLIAMINVIMGVALSALVIAHILQALAFLALWAHCLSCIPRLSCGYGWGNCPDDCSNMKDVDDAVKDVDDAVHEILKVTHIVEVGLAVGWPWVAAGKSTSLVPQTNQVPLTTSFAYSQVPSSGDISAASFGLLNLKDPNDKNSDRYGLPVTSDSYQDLCRVATLDVGGLYGLLPSSVSSALGGGLDWMANWICDSGEDSNLPTIAIETFALTAFSIVCCVPYVNCDLFIGGPVPSALPGDMKDVGKSDHKQSPMKLIKAKMGTDYFGVWSTAIGNYGDTLTSKRVQIAGIEAKRGVKVVADLPADVNMGVTRAEFYYDPKGSIADPSDTIAKEIGPSPPGNTVYTSDGIPIPNVMWNMRWRARLRRYHNFPGALGAGSALEAALLNMGSSTVASRALSELMSGGDIVGLQPSDVKVDKENNEPAKDIYH